MRWSGWGAVPAVFDDDNPDHAEARQELRTLLGERDYAAARRSTLNAHYTDLRLVEPIWEAVHDLGLTRGQVLEPGCGAGNFLGTAPEGIAVTGVEVEPTTAAIAAALYPHAQILAGSFADVTGGEAYFDAVVGNVPFGRIRLHDPEYNPTNQHSIHNHFILKSLRMTRPGGVVALLTSRYTLDSTDPSARAEIADLADLITAIRLPSGAHQAAAGTTVVTDLLVLRRRDTTESPAPQQGWQQTRPLAIPTDDQLVELEVNEWFHTHPEHVLGTFTAGHGPYREHELTVSMRHPDLAEALRTRLRADVRAAQESGMSIPTPTTETAASEVRFRDDAEQLVDGQIRIHGTGFDVWAEGHWIPYEPTKKDRAELRVLLELRDATQALLAAEQQNPNDTTEIGDLRARLNRDYDQYAATWGPINRFTWRTQNRTPWHVWARWCRDRDYTSIPTSQQALLEYLQELGTAGAGSDRLTKHFAAIRNRHRDKDTGLDHTTIEAAQEYLSTLPETDSAHFIPSNHGLTTEIRVTPAQGGFRSDPMAPLVAALEDYDPVSGIAAKAQIFTQRVITPVTPRTATESPTDAISLCLNKHGRLDLDTIAELLGLNGAEEARDKLGELVFTEPDTGQAVLRNDYLSGNVRAKLRTAAAAAEQDPRWQPNVDALTEVVPADLGPEEIEVQLGSWVDASYVQQFIRELLGDDRITVDHPGENIWTVNGGSRTSPAARQEWGTGQRPAQELLEATLTGRPIRVTYKDSDGAIRTDAPATEAAKLKAVELGDRFASWVWEDTTRARALVEQYNDRFNAEIPRRYDDIDLDLPGLSPAYELRGHQKNAVAAQIFNPAVGLFHEVGAGKTLEMIVGAMECRRLGLTNRQVVIVPNHMLEQFRTEWLRAYPQARLLAATRDDLTVENRRRFVARVATGSWDAIILTRTGFQALPVRRETAHAYHAAERDEIAAALENAREAGCDQRTVKQLEEAQANAEESLKQRLHNMPRDPGLCWEDLGIDKIVCDEAQDYKNSRRHSSLPDLGHPGAVRAIDFDIKLAHLVGEYGHSRVVLATATPWTNSLAEIHTIQKRLGLDVGALDNWARTFAELSTTQEMIPGGGFKDKTRLRKLVNVPELSRQLRLRADIRTAEDLNLPTPTVHSRVVEVPASEELADFNHSLGTRYANIPPRPQKGDDNHLSLLHEGVSAALDLRTLDMQTAEPQKVDVLADRVFGRWQEHRDTRYLRRDGTEHPTPGALQLVFCSLSTPKNGWNFYDELRTQLENRGMPGSLIRYIHEAGTDQQKAELFHAARSGEVAVLIGSAEKMGTGVNIQDRAIGLYHITPPWRADIPHQERGRVERQGNQNAEIFDETLVTAPSLDAKRWELVRQKWTGFRPLMTGQITSRVIDMPDEDTDLYGELMAAASGDPRVLEKAKLESEVHRLTRLRQAWARQQTAHRLTIDTAEVEIPRYEQRVTGLKAAIAQRRDTRGEAFAMRIGTKDHTDRTEAAKHLKALLRTRLKDLGQHDTATIPIGELGGHQLEAKLAPGDKVIDITLRFSGVGASVALHHRALPDSHHLVLRLENRLHSLETDLQRQQETITRLRHTAEQAQTSRTDTFAQQEQLDQKSTRLAALTHALTTGEPEPDTAETGAVNEHDDTPVVEPETVEQPAAETDPGAGTARADEPEPTSGDAAASAEQPPQPPGSQQNETTYTLQEPENTAQTATEIAVQTAQHAETSATTEPEQTSKRFLILHYSYNHGVQLLGTEKVDGIGDLLRTERAGWKWRQVPTPNGEHGAWLLPKTWKVQRDQRAMIDFHQRLQRRLTDAAERLHDAGFAITTDLHDLSDRHVQAIRGRIDELDTAEHVATMRDTAQEPVRQLWHDLFSGETIEQLRSAWIHEHDADTTADAARAHTIGLIAALLPDDDQLRVPDVRTTIGVVRTILTQGQQSGTERDTADQVQSRVDDEAVSAVVAGLVAHSDALIELGGQDSPTGRICTAIGIPAIADTLLTVAYQLDNRRGGPAIRVLPSRWRTVLAAEYPRVSRYELPRYVDNGAIRGRDSEVLRYSWTEARATLLNQDRSTPFAATTQSAVWQLVNGQISADEATNLLSHAQERQQTVLDAEPGILTVAHPESGEPLRIHRIDIGITGHLHLRGHDSAGHAVLLDADPRTSRDPVSGKLTAPDEAPIVAHTGTVAQATVPQAVDTQSTLADVDPRAGDETPVSVAADADEGSEAVQDAPEGDGTDLESSSERRSDPLGLVRITDAELVGLVIRLDGDLFVERVDRDDANQVRITGQTGYGERQTHTFAPDAWFDQHGRVVLNAADGATALREWDALAEHAETHGHRLTTVLSRWHAGHHSAPNEIGTWAELTPAQRIAQAREHLDTLVPTASDGDTSRSETADSTPDTDVAVQGEAVADPVDPATGTESRDSDADPEIPPLEVTLPADPPGTDDPEVGETRHDAAEDDAQAVAEDFHDRAADHRFPVVDGIDSEHPLDPATWGWTLAQEEPNETGHTQAWLRDELLLALNYDLDDQLLVEQHVYNENLGADADWIEINPAYTSSRAGMEHLLTHLGRHGIALPTRQPGRRAIEPLLSPDPPDALASTDGRHVVRDENGWRDPDTGEHLDAAVHISIPRFRNREAVARYVLRTHTGSQARNAVAVLLSGRTRNGLRPHQTYSELETLDADLYRRAVTASVGQARKAADFDTARAQNALRRLANDDARLPINTAGQNIELDDDREQAHATVVEVRPVDATTMLLVLQPPDGSQRSRTVPADAAVPVITTNATESEVAETPTRQPQATEQIGQLSFDSLTAPSEHVDTAAAARDDQPEPTQLVESAFATASDEAPQGLTDADIAHIVEHLGPVLINTFAASIIQGAPTNPTSGHAFSGTRDDTTTEPGVHESLYADRSGIRLDVHSPEHPRAGHIAWRKLARWLVPGLDQGRAWLLAHTETVYGQLRNGQYGTDADFQTVIELRDQVLATIAKAAQQAHETGNPPGPRTRPAPTIPGLDRTQALELLTPENRAHLDQLDAITTAAPEHSTTSGPTTPLTGEETETAAADEHSSAGADAEEPAPLNDSDIAEGLRHIAPWELSRFLRSIHNGKPVNPANFSGWASWRSVDAPDPRAPERGEFSGKGLWLRVDGQNGAREGTITWRKLAIWLAPALNDGTAWLLQHAHHASLSVKHNASGYRAIGEARLAQNAENQLDTYERRIANRIIATALHAHETGTAPTRRQRSSGLPELDRDRALQLLAPEQHEFAHRIAQLLRTMPEKTTTHVPASALAIGDVLEHPGYYFGPFRLTGLPTRDGDTLVLRGELLDERIADPETIWHVDASTNPDPRLVRIELPNSLTTVLQGDTETPTAQTSTAADDAALADQPSGPSQQTLHDDEPERDANGQREPEQLGITSDQAPEREAPTDQEEPASPPQEHDHADQPAETGVVEETSATEATTGTPQEPQPTRPSNAPRHPLQTLAFPPGREPLLAVLAASVRQIPTSIKAHEPSRLALIQANRMLADESTPAAHAQILTNLAHNHAEATEIHQALTVFADTLAASDTKTSNQVHELGAELSIRIANAHKPARPLRATTPPQQSTQPEPAPDTQPDNANAEPRRPVQGPAAKPSTPVTDGTESNAVTHQDSHDRPNGTSEEKPFRPVPVTDHRLLAKEWTRLTQKAAETGYKVVSTTETSSIDHDDRTIYSSITQGAQERVLDLATQIGQLVDTAPEPRTQHQPSSKTIQPAQALVTDQPGDPTATDSGIDAHVPTTVPQQDAAAPAIQEQPEKTEDRSSDDEPVDVAVSAPKQAKPFPAALADAEPAATEPSASAPQEPSPKAFPASLLFAERRLANQAPSATPEPTTDSPERTDPRDTPIFAEIAERYGLDQPPSTDTIHDPDGGRAPTGRQRLRHLVALAHDHGTNSHSGGRHRRGA